MKGTAKSQTVAGQSRVEVSINHLRHHQARRKEIPTTLWTQSLEEFSAILKSGAHRFP